MSHLSVFVYKKLFCFSLISLYCALIFSGNTDHKALFPKLVFHQTIPTLEKIKQTIINKEKGMYLRFGDGDVNLAECVYDSYQEPRQDLAKEMREAFALNGPTILKTLPLYCPELNGVEEGMFPGNCLTDIDWCLQILKRSQKFWNAEITDVYSHAAIRFAFVQYPDLCIEFSKFLKQQNCCLLVGNKNIPDSVRSDLFGPQCHFVPTPDRNSYSEIDRIERECLEKISNDDTYKIIIISMGCSGRVLGKRLWKKLDHIFLFDYGSLMDAFCGLATRDWIWIEDNKHAIDKIQKFLEALREI